MISYFWIDSYKIWKVLWNVLPNLAISFPKLLTSSKSFVENLFFDFFFIFLWLSSYSVNFSFIASFLKIYHLTYMKKPNQNRVKMLLFPIFISSIIRHRNFTKFSRIINMNIEIDPKNIRSISRYWLRVHLKVPLTFLCAISLWL